MSQACLLCWRYVPSLSAVLTLCPSLPAVLCWRYVHSLSAVLTLMSSLYASLLCWRCPSPSRCVCCVNIMSWVYTCRYACCMLYVMSDYVSVSMPTVGLPVNMSRAYNFTGLAVCRPSNSLQYCPFYVLLFIVLLCWPSSVSFACAHMHVTLTSVTVFIVTVY